jgi:hypothetical protein
MLKRANSKNELQQGDIVKSLYFDQLEADIPALCLTPACDLAEQKDGRKKADYVLFTPIFLDTEFIPRAIKENYSIDIETLNSEQKAPSNSQKDKIRPFIKSLVGDNNIRYFWIWNENKNKGYVVDFQFVQTIKLEDALKLKRAYSLNSSYKERIASKYGSYMGRIGTEDLKYDELSDALYKEIIKF